MAVEKSEVLRSVKVHAKKQPSQKAWQHHAAESKRAVTRLLKKLHFMLFLSSADRLSRSAQLQ